VNKIRSIIQWYRRWRGCNYRDLYRLVYGDERTVSSKGLTDELQSTLKRAELWRDNHDKLYLRLKEISELHTQDERFKTDCISACKEGYPCKHLAIATGVVNERKKKMS